MISRFAARKEVGDTPVRSHIALLTGALGTIRHHIILYWGRKAKYNGPLLSVYASYLIVHRSI
jgi:hypothetical protein